MYFEAFRTETSIQTGLNELAKPAPACPVKGECRLIRSEVVRVEKLNS